MIWIILQLIFCAVPFAASFVLYKSKRRFMANFYMAMVHRVKARKLYVQVWLMLLLFFTTLIPVYISESLASCSLPEFVPPCSRSGGRINGSVNYWIVLVHLSRLHRWHWSSALFHIYTVWH